MSGADIFGVDVAGIINGAFAGQLHMATLHKVSRVTDDYGAQTETLTDYTCEGVRLSWSSQTVAARGWPVGTVRIVLLRPKASSNPDPDTGDIITILGDRWRVIATMQDPVNATWTLAGVRDNG